MRLASLEKPVPPPAAANRPINPWVAVPLVALAGCVDAIGWLRFEHLFVSFISGTSTMLGVAAAEGHAGRAAALGSAIGLFAVGALAGAMLGQGVGKWRSPAVLAMVAVLLTAALLAPDGTAALPAELPWAAYGMVPAMGMLNTALPGVGGITFVTGALSRAAEGLVAALAGTAPRWAWTQQAACWMAMVAGAVLGAWLQLGWGDAALAVPTTAALLAALLAALGVVGSSR